MEEVWQPVRGYEGLYEVSDQGQVRSLDRKIKRGKGVWSRPGFILKSRTDPKIGYPYVNLCKNGQTKQWRLHTLVLVAFVGLPKQGQQCRHLNGNRNDPRLCNVAWGTAKENSADRALHGTQAVGVRHGSARLTETDVREIRRRYCKISSRHGNGGKLANEYGVTIGQIHNIVTRKAWAHIQ